MTASERTTVEGRALPDRERGRTCALVLLIIAACSFGYALGRQNGELAASEGFDRQLTEVARAVAEQNQRMEKAGMFEVEQCEDLSPHRP